MENTNTKSYMKIFGLFSVFIFAIGILVISLESVQIETERLRDNYHPMIIYMENINMNYTNKN